MKRVGEPGTTPNPAASHDYLVRYDLIYRRQNADTPVTVTITYVPDRLILVQEDLKSWVEDLGGLDTLEATATEALEALFNALVPRWLRVDVVQNAGDAGRHAVWIEERQPDWRNDTIFANPNRP